MKKDSIKVIIIMICAVMIQLLLYRGVKLVQGDPILIGSAFDNKIGFSEFAIIPYVLWYACLFLIPFLFYKKDKDLFLKYMVSYISISVISDIIFIIYPTIVNRPEVFCNNILCSFTKFIYSTDIPPINCFPSLHCGVSFLWMIYALDSKVMSKSNKLIISLISLSVVVSTLFIKQHVIIDVIGGLFLAIAITVLIKLLNKKVLKINKYLKL